MTYIKKTLIILIAVGIIMAIGAIAYSTDFLQLREQVRKSQSYGTTIKIDRGIEPTGDETAFALAKVEKFMGSKIAGLEIKGIKIHPASKQRIVDLISPNANFTVNLDSGNVEHAFFLNASKSSSQSADFITREQALANAKNFARSHFTGFEELNLERIKGPYDSSDYNIEWRDDNTPRFIHVGVDSSTGSILDYTSNTDTRTVNPKPTISNAKAVNIAKDVAKIKEATATINTHVWYDKKGNPALILMIELGFERQTILQHDKLSKPIHANVHDIYVVDIDAHSGEIISSSGTAKAGL